MAAQGVQNQGGYGMRWVVVFFLLAFALALLMGCANYSRDCTEEYGFTPGTDMHRMCVMTLNENAKLRAFARHSHRY